MRFLLSVASRIATVLGLMLCAVGVRADLPLQPYVPYWQPDDAPNSLLDYDYDSDPDQPFNKASAPLASRFSNAAVQANPHARPGEGRVMSLAAFNVTGGNASQGSDSHYYYAFSQWQYLDALVFWGGAAGVGNILQPNGPLIDAAHRNGVPVYGNIFLPPQVYGGQIDVLSDLVQKAPDGSFPLADKLIEIAEKSRFDGWFINQETEGANSALAAQTRDFMLYLRQNSDLDIVWYDSMIESGQIAWQGGLNTLNNEFFEGDAPGSADRAADSMFLDFRWSENSLTNSANYARQLRRNRYDLYAGVNVEGPGWDQTGEPLDQIFPEGQAHRTSMAFYRPEWTLRYSSNIEDFYSRERRFWSGANEDPSDTSGTVGNAGWKGVAHYIAEKSPIHGSVFVSNFNMGQGFDYWVNGELSRAGEWNNMSLQDVTPTWRWDIDASSNPLQPEIDFTDAFTGGSSLRVSGALTSQNDLRLYMTNLTVSVDSNLQIAFKTDAPEADSNMHVLVAFDDDPTNFTALSVGASTGGEWDLRTLSLGGFAGKTISQIGLRFDGANPDYEINIGRLGVIEGEPDAPAAPSNLHLLEYGSVNSRNLTMRLEWDHSPDYAPDETNEVYYYNLYKVSPNGTRYFLGGTPNNSFFVRNLERIGGDDEVTILVEAVGNEFGVSSSESFLFDWRDRSVGLAGDYNEDGMVDAADYAVWRNHLGGSAGSLPNDPTNDLIGNSQYLAWRKNFGRQLTGVAPSALAAPEPSCLALLLGCTLLLPRSRRA